MIKPGKPGVRRQAAGKKTQHPAETVSAKNAKVQNYKVKRRRQNPNARSAGWQASTQQQ